jgi:phosphohistidine phosphatase SixA
MKIITIRHALSDVETKEVNEKGFKQIETLIKRLKRKSYPGKTILICSPVLRAEQTGKKIAEAFEGMKFKLVRCLENQDSYYCHIFMGELKATLEEVAESYESCLIVTHLPTVNKISYMLDPEIREQLGGPKKFFEFGQTEFVEVNFPEDFT